MSNHQKTITSVKLASASGGGFPGGDSAPRLLSASLDGHVKVYEINDFKVRHSCVAGGESLKFSMASFN